jgi:hypothetical protein
MRDISSLAGMFLIALSSTILHVPVGPRRVRGLIAMIVALSAAGPFCFWSVRAPIGATLETVLGIAFATTVIVFGVRDSTAGNRRWAPRKG